MKEVGHNIPIQELFDVAIGTSTGGDSNSDLLSVCLRTTGGIIALGLFKMNWSVGYAINQFLKFREQAFSHRQLLRVPTFKDVAQLFCSFRYQNGGIESALKRAFGRGPPFGQPKRAQGDRVKVGVVVGIPGERQPYLFTNYTRTSTGQGITPRRVRNATAYIVRRLAPERRRPRR